MRLIRSFGRFSRAWALPIALLALAACKSPEPDIPDTPVDELYNNALDTLNAGNTRQAAKLFDEVERQHPYSTWATQAQLMSAYSYYLIDSYDDAIPALERFIDLHPGNGHTGHASRDGKRYDAASRACFQHALARLRGAGSGEKDGIEPGARPRFRLADDELAAEESILRRREFARLRVRLIY